MGRLTLGIIVLLLTASAALAQGKGIRFWNLTTKTVNKLYLSPAGKDAWGANQCENDNDGEVDHRERLAIKGVEPGRYDVRLGYEDGRICLVRNVELKDGGVFSIQDKDLKNCRKQ
jgi:hypothetical protein